MPFVQRVVLPINVAQATAASLGHAGTRFQCLPGKCKNNNCINKQTPTPTDETDSSPCLTRALVHDAPSVSNCEQEPRPPASLPMKKLKQHVEFLPSTTATTSSSSPTRTTPTSPTRARASQSLPNSRHPSQQRAALPTRNASASAPHSPTASPTATRIISGYEFDSISNITLSNALRQLASLVLIASDIFDDLQRELQSVGERAGRVQRKILAVERRVCAYDPKMVTVPESDLLTFAQRKQHFDSDKSFQQELFTNDSRPHSVRQLYKDAGKELILLPMAVTPLRSVSFNGDVQASDDILNGTGDATVVEEPLLCSDLDFGNANQRLRTRIDAEIEIRLPAAIEDLRKWTSSEALGDVTVTPDCMHHVDTSICTSMVIGDNGILTPALSPSVLSADAVDAQYAINISQTADSAHQHQQHHNHHHHHHQQQQQLLLPNDINKDVPLNHRLPSPEEQTKIIALKYPAEVISVNTSGKHFQRMCAARKSTTGCYAGGGGGGGAGSATPSSGSPEDNQAEANNLDDNVQTVSRRSRSRKVRGKRRNTIAGIDQKEIQDAANGTGNSSKNASNATSPAPAPTVDATKKSKKFGRSKSSDILKKESVALPYDKGKNTLTRLNSLKQWGRNRFKFMQRNGNELSGESSQLDTSGCSSQNSCSEKAESSNHCSLPQPGSGVSSSSGGGSGMKSKRETARDIDDECVVHDLIAQKSESRFSHERKPSYSSSEKSMSVSSSGQLRGKLQLSSLASAAAHVKMRETATLNRQRRNGLHRVDAAGKEEQPHSSSGNWSASSESGRASIGSEITMQPKSSASNTSLNVSSFQPCSSSGPPSSMLSRRRFLNTSASSSVTSEGTATPELQTDAGAYPNHLDDETSSAYSCDTEGYYTSFHMDSGLRTLKEEEPPMTPLQQSLHTSSYSFGSQSNQTVLNAENEYELYGRGSTSTTTSSAGTVCTTLMNAAICSGPDVPERSSSLGKHSSQSRSQSQSRSNSNSASSSTLERSYSSSTIGSTLERTGTIKRNVKLATNSEDALQQQQQQSTEEQQQQRLALPLPVDLEYSECSDLEGVERIERIKQKTTLSAKRIPSMCIITPNTSDDDEHQSQSEAEADRTLTNLQVDVTAETDIQEQLTPTNSKDHNLNELKHTPTKAFGGVFEKLRVVLPAIKRNSPLKLAATASAVNDDKLYDVAGEYVTIADISNNNNQNNRNNNKSKSNLAIYYSNDIVRRAEGGGGSVNHPSEYVSLNELPQHLRRHAAGAHSESEREQACAELPQLPQPSSKESSGGLVVAETCSGVPMYAEISELREEKSLLSSQRRVRTNAEGRIIYDSDSLKRRKGQHTTFAPGPYVKKETESGTTNSGSAARDAATCESASGQLQIGVAAATKSAKLLLLNGGGNSIAANRKVANVRPIVSTVSASAIKSPANMATGSYQEQKQLLANNTNPFYETIANGNGNSNSISNMMPSPSSKSNSSTGSTATNSSSSTATTASANSGEEESSPPALPPRMKVNGSIKAKGETTAGTCLPNGLPLPAATTLLIDPIAATQFSISNAIAAPTSSSLSHSHSQSANKSRAGALKRNNSYRLANDELKLEMNKENYSALPPLQHATSSLKLRNLQLLSSSNSGSPGERKIAKSFERLVDEFSLSTTCIDSSYLKNKSLENFDDSPSLTAVPIPDVESASGVPSEPDNDSEGDSEDEETLSMHAATSTPHKYHKSFVESVLLRPLKIIRPNEDNGARRQRILQKFEVTEICSAFVSYVLNGASVGYQRFSNIYEQVQPAPQLNTAPPTDATPFQRNAPVYWTLQNRRSQPKALPGGNVTCRDDLYATPIRRADRLARAAASSNGGTAADGKSNISPIVPRNGSGIFLTSTPTRSDASASENVPPMKQPAKNWSDNAPERLNTCADRIGQSKTTLMDFKKLLLAKSAKTSPVQRKVSAVELLKKSSAPANKMTTTTTTSSLKPIHAAPGASKPTLNSSLKLLDLSGSPKTFANRRMLRQGQFGSPSKTFAPKIRGPSAAIASVGPRTDIMSTTIPEANSEEDHSNNSGGSRASLESSSETAARTVASPNSVAVSSFDLKRNFFLQTEENNFMRGELKPSFGRNGIASSVGVVASAESNKYVTAPTSLPAFETAL
ncbi:hypothetical protein ACLKA7_009231 [Drosophila subpalustris]